MKGDNAARHAACSYRANPIASAAAPIAACHAAAALKAPLTPPHPRRERIAAPGDDVLVLRCGPPPMNRAVEGFLNDLGYSADNVFVF